MVPQPEEAGAYPATSAANDQEDASGRQLSIGLRDACFLHVATGSAWLISWRENR
jgi:hypothetical protein